MLMKRRKKKRMAVLKSIIVLGILAIAGAGSNLLNTKASSESSGEEQQSKKEKKAVQKEESAVEEKPETYLITEFPLIEQMPELPTGCEITALTMALDYYGFAADKVEMATRYLPTLPDAGTYVGNDGRIYGNDLNQYFIGDPQTENGIICGTGAIKTAADRFLEACDSPYRAEERTGISLEELYQLVSEDTPCVVWCTIGMQDRVPQQGWYTQNGEYVDWAVMDHGAVLIGYSAQSVTIADPIAGIVKYDRTQFEKVFRSRGNKCVFLKESETVEESR